MVRMMAALEARAIESKLLASGQQPLQETRIVKLLCFGELDDDQLYRRNDVEPLAAKAFSHHEIIRRITVLFQPKSDPIVGIGSTADEAFVQHLCRDDLPTVPVPLVLDQ